VPRAIGRGSGHPPHQRATFGLILLTDEGPNPVADLVVPLVQHRVDAEEVHRIGALAPGRLPRPNVCNVCPGVLKPCWPSLPIERASGSTRFDNHASPVAGERSGAQSPMKWPGYGLPGYRSPWRKDGDEALGRRVRPGWAGVASAGVILDEMISRRRRSADGRSASSLASR